MRTPECLSSARVWVVTFLKASLRIPTIGIGAGGDVDGQVLVLHDMLGMNTEFNPRFLRRYAQLGTLIPEAIRQYVSDVRDQKFPNDQERY